jgi:hypothetical protein
LTPAGAPTTLRRGNELLCLWLTIRQRLLRASDMTNHLDRVNDSVQSIAWPAALRVA